MKNHSRDTIIFHLRIGERPSRHLSHHLRGGLHVTSFHRFHVCLVFFWRYQRLLLTSLFSTIFLWCGLWSDFVCPIRLRLLLHLLPKLATVRLWIEPVWVSLLVMLRQCLVFWQFIFHQCLVKAILRSLVGLLAFWLFFSFQCRRKFVSLPPLSQMLFPEYSIILVYFKRIVRLALV